MCSTLDRDGARESSQALRRLGPVDAAAATRLTQAVGWPHTLRDWTLHLQLGRASTIGPVVAPDEALAQGLIQALISSDSGFVRVP